MKKDLEEGLGINTNSSHPTSIDLDVLNVQTGPESQISCDVDADDEDNADVNA